MKYYAKGGLLEQAEARIAELEKALRAQLRFSHPNGCSCKGCNDCRKVLEK